MNRNGLYLIVGVLIAAVVILGIYTYQQQQRPALEVRVDGNGLQVNGTN